MEIRLVVFDNARYGPLKFRLFEERGFPPKFKPLYLLNYYANFDKIGVILKEITHRCHFCNKILLL